MPLRSERDKLLFLYISSDVPIITLENYEKWYNVYVVFPGDIVEAIPGDLVAEACGNDGLHIDHDYHPQLLHNLAKIYCGQVDHLALEVAAGRWVLSGHGSIGDTGYIVDQEFEDTMFEAADDNSFEMERNVRCCCCVKVAREQFKVSRRIDPVGEHKLFRFCSEHLKEFNENRHNWVEAHFSKPHLSLVN